MKKYLESQFSLKFDMEINSFSSSTFAKKIEIPGLVIHDIDDKIVSFDEGKKIANSWNTAEFIETKGLGHSLHSDAIYHKIIKFLSL